MGEDLSRGAPESFLLIIKITATKRIDSNKFHNIIINLTINNWTFRKSKLPSYLGGYALFSTHLLLELENRTVLRAALKILN